MPNRKVLAILLAVIFTLSIAGGVAARRVLMQGGAPAARQQKFDKAEFESQFPIVDFDAPEVGDSAELTKRRNISKKFDKAIAPINTHADTIFDTTDWETGLPAMPVAQSQLIVLGEVIDAQAHLSDDKTGIYSEFTIRIEKMLKDDGLVSAASGDTVSVVRGGGRVRFPTGHVLLSRTAGQGMPRLGRRYVLFLKNEGGTQSFGILTGYELKAGRVALLDNPGGGTHPIAKYEGVDEATFLNELQAAISH